MTAAIHATTPPPPPARQHLAVLARRLARALALDDATLAAVAGGALDPLPPPLAALWSVAQFARRLEARGVDAVHTPVELRVALDAAGPDEALAPGRVHAQVLRALGVPLALEYARFVSLPAPLPDRGVLPTAAALARACLSRVRSMEAEALLDVDPEGVHQLRVAVRRLRLVLRLLGHARPDAALADVVSAAKRVGELGGRVRDLDVVAQLLGELAPPGAARDAALAHLAPPRRAALARLRRGLSSASHRAGMARADAALVQLAARADDEPLSDVAQACFARELRRLARRLHGDLSAPGAYHDVRRQSRRVRDAADLLGPVLRKSQRQWRRRLQPVQALLGRLNDLDVALALVPPALEAARPVREQLVLRRCETLAEVATPLALIAVALREG